MLSIKARVKILLLKYIPAVSKYRFWALSFYKNSFSFLQHLPGNSKYFGPPRGIYHNIEAYNKSNSSNKIKEVLFSEKKEFLRKPVRSNSALVAQKFNSLKSVYTLKKATYIFKDARYLGGLNGTVITDDDKIFFHAPYFGMKIITTCINPCIYGSYRR